MRSIARAAADRNHRADLLLRADAGEAAAVERTGKAFHRARDRPSVRRLARPRLRRRAAQGALPPNIEVTEFFFLAGKWLRNAYAQQHYISANYTHAASYILDRGLNVITQLVAKRVVNGETRYSLSCNTDTTLDLLRARAEGRASFMLVGQVNSELPFMPGDAAICRPRSSAPSSIAPPPIFRCSLRRRAGVAIPNMPSVCTRRG